MFGAVNTKKPAGSCSRVFLSKDLAMDQISPDLIKVLRAPFFVIVLIALQERRSFT